MRTIHWFRNDLRLHDNIALSDVAARASQLLPVFVLDPHLLAAAGAHRTRFLIDSLQRLDADLQQRGSRLIVRHGDPVYEIPRVVSESGATVLAFNRDYSPYARRRDRRVSDAVRRSGADVVERKDRVIFESDEIRTASGTGYVVYTPYRRAWLAHMRQADVSPVRLPRLPPPIGNVASAALPDIPPGSSEFRGGEAAGRRRLQSFLEQAAGDYDRQRDVLAAAGTSQLSPHLRFGTISVRECLHAARERRRSDRAAAKGLGTWIDQLIWRDFYAAILAQHPRVLTGAFRREYAAVEWNDDDTAFAAWCAGRTGYPIVDAAMRQMTQTGWMHNRGRMIVASFLVKDLLLDWRRGEAFFMQHLVDGDPANNNGGWQWSASTGTDAQPYFRIFNPVLQGQRFDPRGDYVRRYVPELKAVADRFIHRPWDAPTPPDDYPPPIVDHAERRAIAIARFEAARRAAGKD